ILRPVESDLAIRIPNSRETTRHPSENPRNQPGATTDDEKVANEVAINSVTSMTTPATLSIICVPDGLGIPKSLSHGRAPVTIWHTPWWAVTLPSTILCQLVEKATTIEMPKIMNNAASGKLLTRG